MFTVNLIEIFTSFHKSLFYYSMLVLVFFFREQFLCYSTGVGTTIHYFNFDLFGLFVSGSWGTVCDMLQAEYELVVSACVRAHSVEYCYEKGFLSEAEGNHIECEGATMKH